ncbi:MAG TPA: YaaR family protein [Pseudobacteroides sp.]|uniref:YaaR family protein n=1 Tax=Pseudobacteroides sp. TaxID=1968840 RepID=UPI002F91EBCD
MKVRNFGENTANISEPRSREDRKVSESRSGTFQTKLAQAETSNFDERVRNMLNKIVEQGEKLSKKIDIRDFKVYKTMISEFLDEIVNNSHKFSKKSFLDRRGRHKVYAVIKRINEELDLLAKEFLKDEKDNIQILQRLDDIRGLILDITM